MRVIESVFSPVEKKIGCSLPFAHEKKKKRSADSIYFFCSPLRNYMLTSKHSSRNWARNYTIARRTIFRLAQLFGHLARRLTPKKIPSPSMYLEVMLGTWSKPTIHNSVYNCCTHILKYNHVTSYRSWYQLCKVQNVPRRFWNVRQPNMNILWVDIHHSWFRIQGDNFPPLLHAKCSQVSMHPGNFLRCTS